MKEEPDFHEPEGCRLGYRIRGRMFERDRGSMFDDKHALSLEQSRD